jgi:hypothetical protein
MRSLIVTLLSMSGLWLYGSAAQSYDLAHAQHSNPTVRIAPPHVSLSGGGYLSVKADRAQKLERAIVRSAERERWWMLFVGITLIGYRLMRQHQALFEGSLLSLDYELRTSKVGAATAARPDGFES